MAKDISSLRNLAIVGHGGAGKTTLSEALLLEAGKVTRVPAGVMDFAADEKEKGRSIDSSLAQFSWNDYNLTLIDCPGYQDFVRDCLSALAVVETAVVVVSAADGVTVNTRRMWKASEEQGNARIIVVTKLDGDNVSFDKTVESIQEQLSDKCFPFIIPVGEGADLAEVANIMRDSSERCLGYRGKLIEAVVETNEEMLERYLMEEEIPVDELYKQFKKAIQQGQVYPIITIVPSKNIGIKQFLEFVGNVAPSPQDVEAKTGTLPGSEDEIKFEVSPDAPFSAQVFKVFNDPFGRVSYFRIYSGQIKAATSVYVSNREKTEKIGHLLTTLGSQQEQIEDAGPGEIVAISKVEGVQIGDTLSDEKKPVVYPPMEYPIPMVSLAARPASRGDEQKISASLVKLAEEDPTFITKRDEETSELIVSGMSNLHLDVILGRLKSRFKVQCDTTAPKIAYRETITAKGETRFRHKKQSGGSGEFAEVAIRMAPAERGKGFEFIDKIVGGVIPSQFIASAQKGMETTMNKGILAGYPVVDVQVELFDGKTHAVDSNDSAFQMAGSKSFQEGFMKCKPVLLEPVYNVSITVPGQFMGDVMGDLNSRRGRIMGSDSEGDYQIIHAQVPLREIQSYSTELKAFTGGEGTYTTEFSHYDVVPSNLQEKIIAETKQSEEEK